MSSLMQHLMKHDARAVRTLTLAALVLLPAAHATAQVMKEHDINAQSVTNALAPDDEGEPVQTRGFVLSKPGDSTTAPAPAAAAPGTQSAARHAHAHALKAHAHAANMLITFESNSITLTQSAQSALDQVATALQSERLSAYKFRVEGHADPRGQADANMKLSQDRAAAVVDYLTQKGIDAERLTAVGKGSSEPMNRRNPAAPENRRVTIVTVTD